MSFDRLPTWEGKVITSTAGFNALGDMGNSGEMSYRDQDNAEVEPIDKDLHREIVD